MCKIDMVKFVVEVALMVLGSIALVVAALAWRAARRMKRQSEEYISAGKEAVRQRAIIEAAKMARRGHCSCAFTPCVHDQTAELIAARILDLGAQDEIATRG